jgi:hypothetical protein
MPYFPLHTLPADGRRSRMVGRGGAVAIKIFDADLQQRVRTIYSGLEPEQQYNLTYPYNLVVSPSYQRARDEMEALLPLLPSGKRGAFIASVRQFDPAFIDTYHELVVGGLLDRLDYDLTYETQVQVIRGRLGLPRLNNPVNTRTPDWFARHRGSGTAFILDVYTSRIPGQQPDNVGQIERLMSSLRALEIDAHIGVSPPRNDVRLGASFGNSVARLVEEWLRSNDPQPGGVFMVVSTAPPGSRDFGVPMQGIYYPADKVKPSRSPDNDAIAFMVFRRNTGNQKAVVHAGPRPYFVEASAGNLQGEIERKVLRYSAAGLPFVVAAVADPMTALSVAEFEDALFGERNVYFGRRHDGSVGPIFDRKRNGVLRGPWATVAVDDEENSGDGPTLMTANEGDPSADQRNALSAGVLLAHDEGGASYVYTFHNPRAMLPLPHEALPNPTSVTTPHV